MCERGKYMCEVCVCLVCIICACVCVHVCLGGIYVEDVYIADEV